MRYHGAEGGAEPPADRDGRGGHHGGKDCCGKKAVVIDQGEYQKSRNELVAQYEAGRDGYDKISGEISDRQGK